MIDTRFEQDACRWIYPGQIVPASELTRRRLFQLLHTYLPLRAMAWFRLGSRCKAQGIKAIPGFTQRLIFRRFGFEILVGADIGGGLYVPHPVGTVISPNRIGHNCSIIANVTIGMRNEWKFPTIGDDVFIGAGARVLGGITIGDRAIIGANAVVIHDIPAGSTAVGIPARVVQKN
jgi:serine O-acetyltransferase